MIQDDVGRGLAIGRIGRLETVEPIGRSPSSGVARCVLGSSMPSCNPSAGPKLESGFTIDFAMRCELAYFWTETSSLAGCEVGRNEPY
jgi:hypothetical protein